MVPYIRTVAVLVKQQRMDEVISEVKERALNGKENILIR